MADDEMHEWHVRLLSPGGGIDSYLRVKATTIQRAIRRAQKRNSASKRKDRIIDLPPEEWECIYAYRVEPGESV